MIPDWLPTWLVVLLIAHAIIGLIAAYKDGVFDRSTTQFGRDWGFIIAAAIFCAIGGMLYAGFVFWSRKT